MAEEILPMEHEMTNMDRRVDRIAATLRSSFAPAEVSVADDSHLHDPSHPGHRPEGETHYRVRVVSAAFAGMDRVARSRAAYAALAEEFGTGMHALQLELKTPEEAGG